MEFETFFNDVKEKFISTDTSAMEENLAIQINVTGETAGTFYIEVLDGMLSIEPYEYNDRDVAITISADNLKKLISGKADPVLLFTLGKLKVDGEIKKALELKKFLGNV